MPGGTHNGAPNKKEAVSTSVFIITNNTDVHGIIFSDTNAVLRHTSVSSTCHHHHNENARHVGTEHHSVVIQRVIRGGVGVSAAVESYHAALQDGGVGRGDGEGSTFRRV